MIELNVTVINVALEETERFSVELPDHASLIDLLGVIGLGNGDLSHYYEFSGPQSFNLPYLPFLFSGKQILYDVPYKNAKVEDFIRTFELADKGILIRTGYAHAGGPGLCDLKQMWESAYPILEQIAVICTITGLSVATLTKLVKWFCNLFRQRKRTPQVCYDIIYCKSTWNHHELAESLEIDPDRAKKLLVLFGYQYDRHKMLYVRGESVAETKAKLHNTKGLDI